MINIFEKAPYNGITPTKFVKQIRFSFHLSDFSGDNFVRPFTYPVVECENVCLGIRGRS